MCSVPESSVSVLPDVAGKDVVELGCGTAYFSALARAARRAPVGVDLTPAQLETARRMQARVRARVPARRGERRGQSPLPDASFDLVVSEYGASIWCDPYRWIPEAARLLRPGGELVFLRNSTLAILCAHRRGRRPTTLQRPQRGLHRLEWEDDDHDVEFHLGHGDWVRLLRANGFERRSTSSSSTRAEDAPDHAYYDSRPPSGREQWPSEEIWRRASA